MQLRKDIPENYKWDIELFSTEEEIEKALKIIEQSTHNAKKYYNKFNDKEYFFDYFYSNMDTYCLINKLYHYIGNMQSIDGSDVKIKKLVQRVEVLITKNQQAYS